MSIRRSSPAVNASSAPSEVVPGDSQIESEVVSRPGGKAYERQVVLRRRSGDHRQRAVTAGHAERVGSAVHRARDERREIVSWSEHDRLDAPLARSISKGRPRCLAVAGPRIDEQHGSPRRIDALPPFSQSTQTGGHARRPTGVSSIASQ